MFDAMRSLNFVTPINFLKTRLLIAETKEELEQCMADIKVNANQVRGKLKLMERNTEESAANLLPGDLRIQKTQVIYIDFGG